MPSDRQTRRQRHQAAIKPQRGAAIRGAQSTEFVKGAGFRKSEFVGGKKYYTPMSTDPKSSGAGGDITNITISGGNQGVVLANGSVPFTKTQFGVYPTESQHLATMSYVDTSDADKLTKVIDAAATPGTGGQHGNLPGAAGTVGGHVCLIEDGGVNNTEATIYNIASGNSNLTIEDDEDAGGNSFIKFTAADQSVSLHRLDTLYAVDTTGSTTTYTNASGSNGIIFQDTAETTWTIGSLANNKIPVTLDVVGFIPTSHNANSITGTHISVLGNTSGTNTGDNAGVTSLTDANDPGGSTYKSLIVSGSAGAAELIKVKGSGATSVAVTTQGDPVEYFLDISSSNTQRAIDDSPTDGATTTSISSNWAYDNVKTAVPTSAVFTDTNYYLDGVTKSGNTLTFSVSGGASYDETYTFGSNAFNSTAFLTAISSTLATDESASPPRVSILDDGSTVKALEEGTGISIEESATAGGDTVKISSTVNTSGMLTNGIVTIEDSADDTQNAVGADILKFAEDSTSTVGWAVTKASNTITITPELSGYNNSNWNNAYNHSQVSGGVHNTGTTTASSTETFTNKSGNISQWTNNSSYLTGNQTVTLSGDVTGSGTTSISCTVVDDSHNHVQSNVDGLSTSLAAKADLAGPTFTADINVADSIWINGYTDDTASRIRFHHDTNNAYQDWETGNYYIRYDTATKYMMDSSGNFHADNDVYAYSTSVGSDKKLKKNIKDIKYGLSDVMKLRGVDFDWKEKRDGVHDIGVIAQEVREVIPEVVQEVEDLVEDTYLSVDYAKLVPVLIEAIKELKEELDGIRKSR
tara:strand:- start:842 stop:3268 length:2427 start_codon:yes stop_codon:yes gene_type:complete